MDRRSFSRVKIAREAVGASRGFKVAQDHLSAKGPLQGVSTCLSMRTVETMMGMYSRKNTPYMTTDALAIIASLLTYVVDVVPEKSASPSITKRSLRP